MFGLVDFFDSAIPCRGNKPMTIGTSTFIAERILPHHPDSRKFKGSSTQSHCSPPFPQETLRFTETKNHTYQHHFCSYWICTITTARYPCRHRCSLLTLEAEHLSAHLFLDGCVLRIAALVVPFVWVFLVIVQLLRAVFVA